MATAKKTKKIAAPKAVSSKKKAAAGVAAKNVVSKKASSKKSVPAKKAEAKKAKPQPKQTKQPISKKVATKKTIAKKTAPKSAPASKSEKAKASFAKTASAKTEHKKSAPKEAKSSESKASSKQASEKKGNSSKKIGDIKKHTISVAEAIAEILKNKKPKSSAPVEKLPVAGSKQRACAGIYFSIEDLDSYLATRDTAKPEEDASSVSASASTKKSGKVSAAQPVQVPKRALSAASIADILGFNPIEQSRSAFEEKDVPAKWKKYYKLLVEMKNRIQNGSSDKVESVSSSNIQLSHENSTQGMDVADIGAKNFERDMAFNLLSNEQNIISEVNAAIERIRNGTYGICEVTGKAIPESRLLAVPFTRCTIEGQKQKEIEQRRLRAGQRKQQYDVDLSADGQESEVPEDDSE